VLASIKKSWESFSNRLSLFMVTQIGKKAVRLLLWTCKWKVEGLDHFCQIASEEKCILLFWHNRLAIAPFILTTLAPQFTYTAFVSNSRDGDLLSSIIHSFECGRTIRVPHHSRHQALKTLIRHIEKEKDVTIITPDGPRGPRYVMKPGAALAAVESGAHVIPFNWTASKYWTFNTWDALRLPRPFSTIKISFESSLQFQNIPLEEVKDILASRMQETC
jgi:lysophospholipid acyltransferase (LPLAT)-like uncharacterized protein